MANDCATTETTGSTARDGANRLLDELSTSYSTTRDAVEETLQALGREEARIVHQALLERVWAWNRDKRRSERHVLWYAAGQFATLLGPMLFSPLIGMETSQVVAVSGFAAVLVAMLIDGSWYSRKVRAGRASFETALNILAATPNASLAPLLLQLYYIDRYFHIGPSNQRSILQSALVEALTLVQPSDHALFTQLQRRQLISVAENSSLLASGQATELGVAALQVLQSLGEYSAIPVAKRVSVDGLTPSVRHAAKRCYEILNVETLAPENILLRGSASPNAPADTLLRAFSGNNSISPNELLRTSGESTEKLDGEASLRTTLLPLTTQPVKRPEEQQIQLGRTQKDEDNRSNTA